MFKTKGSTDTWPAHGPQGCPQAAPHVALLAIALWDAPLAELPELALQPWGGGGQEKSCIKGRSDPQPQ